MKLKITIQCDNDAFGTDEAQRGMEVARILRDMAQSFEDGGLEDLYDARLNDANGNRAGVAAMVRNNGRRANA